MTNTNQLIKTDTLDPKVIFAEDGLKTLAKEAQAAVDATPQDMETAKGRAGIISLATLVTKSKTGVQALAKEAKAPHQKAIDNINGQLKTWNEDMDTIQKATRKPVTDFENKEVVRKDALKARMTDMEKIVAVSTQATKPEAIGEALDNIKALYEHEWQEYSGVATDLYTDSKDKLQVALSNLNQQIAKDKELEELREKQRVDDEQAEKDRQELEALRAEKAEREAEPEPEPVEDPEPTPEPGTPAPLEEITLRGRGGEIKQKVETVLPKPAGGATTTLATAHKEGEPTTTISDLGKQTLGIQAVDDDVIEIQTAVSAASRLTMEDVTADMYDAVHTVLMFYDIKEPFDTGGIAEALVDAIEDKLKVLVMATNMAA